VPLRLKLDLRLLVNLLELFLLCVGHGLGLWS
jgi:hypothetical protein